MDVLYNYVFKVKKTPEHPEEVVEIYAPSFLKATMMMAAAWPGVHLVEYLGVAPTKGGRA